MPALRFLTWLLVLASSLCCAEAQALHVGDAFPAVSAKSLSGGVLVIPDGHPTVVILGFTQAEGKDASQWTARTERDFPALVVDDLIFLDSAPGFMRSMIAAGIRHGMTPARQAHSIVLDHDGSLWKQRLSGGFPGVDLSHAVAVALDATGHIRAVGCGAVTDGNYAAFRAALEKLP